MTDKEIGKIAFNKFGLQECDEDYTYFVLGYKEAIKKQFAITDVVASLPDANKLYKMAETIVSKQVLIYNMPENRQIDWEDLKNDWFDWLDEEIKG